MVAVVADVAEVADVAVDALPFSAAVIVPALKLPEASRATMVDPVLALVALEVTVNVLAPDWLAVKVAEPDKPVPEVASVSVPLLTVGMSEVNAMVPVAAGIVIVVVPATALGCSVVVPDVEPGNATLEIPVSAWLAEARLSATAVVPT